MIHPTTKKVEYVPGDIEVFVGGRRLRKTDYILYANNEYPYSPITPISPYENEDPIGTVKEGDIKFPSEFAATGTTRLQLAQLPIKIVTNKSITTDAILTSQSNNLNLRL